MSSYLLLRNNKESGPFTIEEIQAMPLKSYDLLWVVGKSAAWRYPGEIAELKSFAPPIPEQISDVYNRKPDSKKNDLNIAAQEQLTPKKTEVSVKRQGESNGQRVIAGRSVYVNLPAEKKSNVKQDRILFEPELVTVLNTDPAYDFSNLYKRQPSKAARYSGKILLISTVVLLFGAGILTGFFISDRRKFFSTVDKPTQPSERIQPLVNNQKKISSSPASLNHSSGDLDKNGLKEPETGLSGVSSNQSNGKAKKAIRPGTAKKDSTVIAPVRIISSIGNDSLKQVSLPESDLLLQRIKANPANYISMETGRYSTGVFGGISSFPVTLTNNSPMMLDLIVVSVDYIQNNGKIFKTETLSFNDLQPGETVTLKAPKSPRGIKINTSMHLVSSRQPDSGASH